MHFAVDVFFAYFSVLNHCTTGTSLYNFAIKVAANTVYARHIILFSKINYIFKYETSLKNDNETRKNKT